MTLEKHIDHIERLIMEFKAISDRDSKKKIFIECKKVLKDIDDELDSIKERGEKSALVNAFDISVNCLFGVERQSSDIQSSDNSDLLELIKIMKKLEDKANRLW